MSKKILRPNDKEIISLDKKPTSAPMNWGGCLRDLKYIEYQDISGLEKLLLAPDYSTSKKIVPVSANQVLEFNQNQISQFCHTYAIYQIPTIELIDFLKKEIIETAIEIGSGNGVIGRSLGIPMTDNCMQKWNSIKANYRVLKTPTINYPNDIIELDANLAVNQYKPQTVIGSWITQKYEPHMEKYSEVSANVFGVDEIELLRKVKKYIHIGNEHTNESKEIFKKYKAKRIYADWLISRSQKKDQNVIYIFRGLA